MVEATAKQENKAPDFPDIKWAEFSELRTSKNSNFYLRLRNYRENVAKKSLEVRGFEQGENHLHFQIGSHAEGTDSSFDHKYNAYVKITESAIVNVRVDPVNEKQARFVLSEHDPILPQTHSTANFEVEPRAEVSK